MAFSARRWRRQKCRRDIVGGAVAARGDGRDDRDHLGAGEQIEQRAVDLDHFTDEAKIKHPLNVRIRIFDGLARLFGEDHVAVLSAKADCPFARLVDQRDDLFVDRAGEHHLDDLDRLLVGDAKPAFEFRFDAHLVQHGADLRAAAVNHDRVDARLLQKRDVAGKGLAELGIAHGVAAIFHHDRLVLVALHERQRLGEKTCLDFAFGLVHGDPAGVDRGPFIASF